ncbi:MAG: TetR/AcrR family transcriptional regulator [Planctomycetota bacterium]|jgi:AcrR family transcriptional regulator
MSSARARKSEKKKRVSKTEWIEAALFVLREEGVKAVRVEDLARRLGISKSGFYWHFEDRRDLLTHLLDYWTREYTEIIADNPEAQKLEPRERLRMIMDMVLDPGLTEYDLPMRAWAAQDPQVARRVGRVYKVRLDFVRKAFAELGFAGDELEMRTRLFVCYQSWERVMFWREPKKALRALIPRRLALLTKK